MLESSQFLHILATEAEHLVNVFVSLPTQVVNDFERRLNDAFVSDSFSDAARAWNAERLHVVQDVAQQHLTLMRTNWAREHLWEDYLGRYVSHLCTGGFCPRQRLFKLFYKCPHHQMNIFHAPVHPGSVLSTNQEWWIQAARCPACGKTSGREP
jgi:hypothetical protein